MILSFINIRKVPREGCKPQASSLGFPHLPLDLANVNEWNIMLIPLIVKKRNEKSYQVQAFCEERGLTPLLGVIW